MVDGDAEPRLDVLIAGGGFIGCYATRACEGRDLRVRAVDRHPNELAAALGLRSAVEACDLLDPIQTSGLLHSHRPRALVVTAQLSLDQEQQPLRQLVLAAAEAGTKRIVVVSSLAVYGAAPHCAEGLPESTKPADPSSYGGAKIAEERAVQEVASGLGLSFLILRSTGVFGRLPAARDSSRAAGAIDRVFRHHCGGERPTLMVEDRADQYLYAGDLGEVIARAVVDPPPFQVMNVGPGCRLSVEKLRAELATVLERSVGLERVRPTGRAVQRLNTDRLDHWFPEQRRGRCDLRTGLQHAANDFLDGAPEL